MNFTLNVPTYHLSNILNLTNPLNVPSYRLTIVLILIITQVYNFLSLTSDRHYIAFPIIFTRYLAAIVSSLALIHDD